MPKGYLGRTPCSVDGCASSVSTGGLCGMHANRLSRTGSTDDPRRSPSMRFWAKVSESSAGCWIFGKDAEKYSTFQLARGKSIVAHRYAYEDMVAEIPVGLTLDHLCRTPGCVRPDHLEPVPQRINTLRGASVVAINAAKTECKRGHALADDNLYVNPSGQRQCRICRKARSVAYLARRKSTTRSSS